jgi:hypothetical protein
VNVSEDGEKWWSLENSGGKIRRLKKEMSQERPSFYVGLLGTHDNIISYTCASAHKKKPQKKKNQTLSKFVISAL